MNGNRLARDAVAMLLILAGLIGVSQPTSAADGEFVNISTRAVVKTGDEVMIGGFILADGPRQVVIHALGPELANRGVSNALADPVLRVIDTTDPGNARELMFNDDWNDSQGQLLTDIWGSVLPFTANSNSSAAVLTLDPGNYTAIVEGKNGTEGIALVEVWRTDSPGAVGNFVNISTRALVETGDEVMIGGFILADGPRQVSIHALGPELASRGVSNALADPVLRVIDTTDPGNARELMFNDDWNDSQGQLLTDIWGSVLPFTAGSNSSAAVLTLDPGNYTAIVEGKNGTEGIALVEVWRIDSAGGQETTHGVGATLSDLPTGSWTPDVTSGGSFLLSGGNATVRLNDGGYIEEGNFRYTCQNSGGCVIENRGVTSGTIVQTAQGTVPGGGGTEPDTQPSFAAGSGPGDQSYTGGTAINTLTLPRATGGNGMLTYSLRPSVPGLNFNAAMRRLTGTPTTAGAHSMTYTVTDADGDTDSLTFTIRVNPADTSPNFASNAGPGNQTYTVGTAINTLTLPRATGGNGMLTYSLRPSVPGLNFNAATRRLTGTPTTAGAHSMTYTVTDADGDTDSLTFTITVTEPPPPSDNYTTLEGLRVEPGRVRFGFLSAGTCLRGLGTINGVVYQVHSSKWQRRDNADSPWEDVPDTEQEGGLCSYNPTVSGEYRMVADITIDGIRGSYASENTITVSGGAGTDAMPIFATDSNPGNQTYTAGTAIDTLPLPEASGGDGTLTYSLSPTVPGLTFNATTRQLTGTPTTAGAHSMTYTVTDEDGDTDRLNFTITVEPDDNTIFEAFEGFRVEPGRVRFGFINTGGCIEQIGNIGGVLYQVHSSKWQRRDNADSPWEDVPDTEKEGALCSYNPTVSGEYRMVADIAIDGIRGSYSSENTITVSGGAGTDAMPIFATDSNPGNQTYTVGTAIDTLTLPEASGGDGTLTYSLSPAVPGLTFDASTRQLTGTPTTAGAHSMTYTVTDEDGDSDSLSFTSTVKESDDGDDLKGMEFDLDPVNGNPASITFANDRFYVPDWIDRKVYAYNASGQRDAASEFDLDSVNDRPKGIIFANDKFYVVDSSDDKVYAYNASGQRDAASEFRVIGTPAGITFANDRFYVPDRYNRNVYAYNASGQRDSLSEFDLDPDNDRPAGITFANGKFYVLDDWFDDKVYVYNAPGQRDAASEFRVNDRPGGITFANDRFYVPKRLDDNVYAYNASGQRDTLSEFDLDPVNRNSDGITFANGKFYVLDGSDDKVYVYNASGQRDAASEFDLDPVNDRPAGITFANDRFHVADSGNRVYAYHTSGQRDAASDFLLHSAITSPSGITFGNGKFYVLDSSPPRVYEVASIPAPDLVVESVSVSDDTPESGGSFMLSVTVRNRGTATSTATTLRAYRSDDRAISTSDMEVGMVSIDALAVADTVVETITLPAPSTGYYYGACVDSVSGESDTSNNCSNAVTVFGYDLKISIVSFSRPSTAIIGQSSIRMTVEVINQGPNASQPAKLRFSGGTSSYLDIPILQSGESTTFENHRVGAAQLGTTTYRACIVEAPGEENADNNCGSRSVTYTLLSPPDEKIEITD